MKREQEEEQDNVGRSQSAPSSQKNPFDGQPNQQPPPKQSQSNPIFGPLEKINAVLEDMDSLIKKIEQFKGTSKQDKEYVYLDEMLTRKLLKLDDIDIQGMEYIRAARKQAVWRVQNCLSQLEAKRLLSYSFYLTAVEERLIEKVKLNRVLYDGIESPYMATQLKNKIWNDIARELAMKDGEEAKAMWMKLRASYRDARKRQLNYVRIGLSPTYIKQWKFQNQMAFLEPFMYIGTGNLSEEIDYDSQFRATEVDNPFEIKAEGLSGDSSQFVPGEKFYQVNEKRTECEHGPIPSGSGTKRTSHTDFSTSPTLTKKTKQSNYSNDVPQQSVLQRQKMRQRAEERKALSEQNNFRDDPLYNFFFSMYQQTKSFPPECQHKVKANVFQAVSEVEADIMKSYESN